MTKPDDLPTALRTEAGRALLARGSNNWSEGDWVRKFAEAIAAVEDQAVLAAIPSEVDPESGLTPQDYWLTFLVAHAEHVHGCDHTGQLRDALNLHVADPRRPTP